MHKENMINNVSNITEENCCGCGACYQICPKHSIQMTENNRGFLVPTIDERTCVNCGTCIKVCPEKRQPLLNHVIRTYAAIAKNKKILNSSTSGGVFGVISECVLLEGGCVYGCMWDENLCAQHTRIEHVEELEKIQSSKYVQSNTKKTFAEVRDDLKQGRIVLYSGTACQIAGLKNFLNGKEDYLITVEVACHGVPSPGLFRKYINWKSKMVGERVSGIRFRDKEKHKKGEHYKFCLNFVDGKKRYYLSDEDPYYGAFLAGKTLRKTCYHCKYKQTDRIADILLGDFWGIEKEHPNFPAQYGASAVTLTSNKAVELFEKVKDKLVIEVSTFNKITKHNKSIVSCAAYSKEHSLKSIELDEDKLFQKLKPAFSIKKRIKNMVPEKIKYILKRLM